MSRIKLYFDLISPPSRALRILLKKSQIPFESRPVHLGKGEHLEPWFEKVNPFKRIPAVEHKGIVLIESISIMRFLCREFPSQNHLYPADSYEQAKVDEYLEWSHIGMRAKCMKFYFLKFLQPMMGISVSEEEIAQAKTEMEVAFDQMNNIWLKEKRFLCGDEISVADIFGICDAEQPRIAGYEASNNRPQLAEWMKRVRGILNPIYDEENSIVYQITQKYKGNPPKGVMPKVIKSLA